MSMFEPQVPQSPTATLYHIRVDTSRHKTTRFLVISTRVAVLLLLAVSVVMIVCRTPKPSAKEFSSTPTQDSHPVWDATVAPTVPENSKPWWNEQNTTQNGDDTNLTTTQPRSESSNRTTKPTSIDDQSIIVPGLQVAEVPQENSTSSQKSDTVISIETEALETMHLLNSLQGIDRSITGSPNYRESFTSTQPVPSPSGLEGLPKPSLSSGKLRIENLCKQQLRAKIISSEGQTSEQTLSPLASQDLFMAIIHAYHVGFKVLSSVPGTSFEGVILQRGIKWYGLTIYCEGCSNLEVHFYPFAVDSKRCEDMTCHGVDCQGDHVRQLSEEFGASICPPDTSFLLQFTC